MEIKPNPVHRIRPALFITTPISSRITLQKDGEAWEDSAQ